MKKDFIGIKAFALCLGTIVLIGANTGMVASASQVDGLETRLVSDPNFIVRTTPSTEQVETEIDDQETKQNST